MEERVAIIGIFITDGSAAAKVNELLHEYSDCIIGRMGVPCREKSDEYHIHHCKRRPGPHQRPVGPPRPY